MMMTCPQCDQEWHPLDYAYCPEDGTELNGPESEAISSDKLRAQQQTSEQDGGTLMAEIQYFDIPILGVGPTKNGDEITEEVFNEVLQSYDPTDVHEAPVVIVPHADSLAGFEEAADKQREAKGFVKRLFAQSVNGGSWIFARIKAASEAAASELKKLLAGPMKFNSPELQRLMDGFIRPEIYTKAGTEGWPGHARNKWYLRRVNLLGAQPPAQFGMPQAALLSDARGQFKIFGGPMADETKKQETKKEETKKLDDAPVTATLDQGAMGGGMMVCPQCGKEYADGSGFCPTDGTKLVSKEDAQKAVQEAYMAEQTQKLSESIRTDFEKKLAEERTAREKIEKQLADERKKLRLSEIEHRIDTLIEKDPVRLNAGSKDKLMKLAEAVDANITIKLSETESYSGPMELVFGFIESLPPITSAGALHLVKDSAADERGKAMAEVRKFQEDNKIERLGDALIKYTKAHPEKERYLR